MTKTMFSYLEYYAYCIRPRLKEIDLFVKTSKRSISISDAASILMLNSQEVIGIMKKEGIKLINRKAFFKIMENGSSDICRLFRREIERKSPHIYSIEDISYIYDIDLEKIKNVCSLLKIKEITPYTLPDVFAQIAI